jgi:hypothetical protein
VVAAIGLALVILGQDGGRQLVHDANRLATALGLGDSAVAEQLAPVAAGLDLDLIALTPLPRPVLPDLLKSAQTQARLAGSKQQRG